MEIGDLVVGYLSHNSELLNKHTINGYAICATKFIEFLGPETHTEEIDHEKLTEFIADLRKRGLSDRTVSYHLCVCKNIIKYCEYLGKKCGVKSVDVPQVKARSRRRRPLKIDHIDLLLKHNTTSRSSFVRLRNELFVRLLFDTGVRTSEFCEIEIPDLDLEQKSIPVQTKKGGVDRVVYWGEETHRVLLRYLQEYRQFYGGALLFTNNRGERINPRTIQRVIKEMADKAGLEGICPASCRTGLATHLNRNGVDLRVVQILLGHTSINTTQIYSQLENSDTRRAYKKAMV